MLRASLFASPGQPSPCEHWIACALIPAWSASRGNLTQQLVAQAANAESRVVALKEQNQRLEKRLEELERRLMLIGEMLDYRESVRQDDEPTVMRG